MNATQRDARNRLTDNDRDRIDNAAREYLTAAIGTDGRIGNVAVDTCRRVAMNAIGCSAHDLTEPELTEITARVLTTRDDIEMTHHERTAR